MIKGAGVLLFASVMLLLLAIPFSGEAEQLDAPDAGGQLVRIGVLARRGSEECLQSWGPTAEYLSRQIKDSHFQIVPLTFEDVVPRVQAEAVDFVIVNSSIYVELQALFGTARIATMKDPAVDYDSTVFGGVIFTRADRLDVQSIEDLKGKSFMGVDETSLGGWRAAWREFKAKRIDPYKDFSKLLFSGTHDAVVYAVRDGEVDAGTVATPILEQMTTEGRIEPGLFRVINAQEHADFPYLHSTRLYPNWPFAKLKHTPNALAEKIVIALLSIPHDSPVAIAAGVSGWTVPLDYGSVDEGLRELRVGIYKDFGKITFVAVLRNYKWQIIGALLAIMVLTGLLLLTLRLNLNLRTSQLALQNQIYEREHAEAALERITEQHERILLSAGEGILGIDLEGTITFANPAARKTLGYEEEELIGKNLHLTIHHSFPDGTHYPVTECPMRQSLQEGTSNRVRNEVLWKKDGTSFPSAYSTTPIMENGLVVGAVLTFRDISLRRRAEDDLKRANGYLENVFENSPDAIGIVDESGKFVRWNRMAEELYGYTFEQMRRMCPFDLYADKDELERMLMRLRQERSVKKWEMLMRKGDGSIAPFEISIGVLRDRENRILGSVAVARDLSEIKEALAALRASNNQLNQEIIERKRAEEKIREQVRFLETLFDTIPNPIFHKDANGRYTGCNRAFLEFTGKPMEGLLGKTVYDMGSKDIADKYAEKDRELFEHPGKQQYEWQVQNTLGEVREVIFDKATLHDAHAAVSGLIGVISDISDRKRAEADRARLEAENRQLQKAESLGRMAGAIAHLFNNQLSVVMGNLELAMMDWSGNATIRKYLIEALRAVGRSSEISRLMLTYLGQGTAKREPLDLSEICRQNLPMLQNAMPEGIALETNLLSSGPVISAHADQVQQVLTHLISNGWESIAHSAGTVTLTTRIIPASEIPKSHLAPIAWEHAAHLFSCLEVTDTGCGMTEEDLDKIFDPFFTTKFTGRGLGLAVVLGIVKIWGGAIGVESKQNQGSIFSVFLPLVTDELPRTSERTTEPPGEE